MDILFFDSWSGILRVAITTVFAYATVVFMLRVSGKRTLAKMNAFDFVVTIALGSILSSVILSKTVPFAEGMVALFLLVGLQYCITFTTARSRSFKKLISNSPTLLFYNSNFFYDVLKRERIDIEEIYKAVRAAGHSGFEEIHAVVLETTGDFSIISNWKQEDLKAMQEVEKKIDY